MIYSWTWAALCGAVALAGVSGLWGIEHVRTPVALDPAPAAIVARESMQAAEANPGDHRSIGADSPAALDTPAALPPETRPAQIAIATTPDPVRSDPKQPVHPLEIVDECFVPEICIDQYLWAAYARTPKQDSIKVRDRTKVTVKRKGKTRTITKTITRLVDEDFTWKDPKAAERAGMPMIDYVIGGMDRNFKLRLYRAIRAMEDAGLEPGITSAFRDDYRQSLASGLKAASDNSYHGGSRHGGYGHGLAADLVSVKGETRAERWVASEALWKWIDAHGKEFGIGRPYLDRDPPHVAPIDGKEYADHRGGANGHVAESKVHKQHRFAVHEDHGATKRAKRQDRSG